MIFGREFRKLLLHQEIAFSQKLTFIHNVRIESKLIENSLIQDNISFTHRNVVNLYIAYELDTWSRAEHGFDTSWLLLI